MRAANCTPQSYPRLPPTHQHPMWQVGARGAAAGEGPVPLRRVVVPAAARLTRPLLFHPRPAPPRRPGTWRPRCACCSCPTCSAATAAASTGPRPSSGTPPPLAWAAAGGAGGWVGGGGGGWGGGWRPSRAGRFGPTNPPGSPSPASAADPRLLVAAPCRVPACSEQLTAFELWLEHGGPDKKPPEQLPIVLQVGAAGERCRPGSLPARQPANPAGRGPGAAAACCRPARTCPLHARLTPARRPTPCWPSPPWGLRPPPAQVLLSQVHRLRALVLLGRFLDMGAWAVDLALSGARGWGSRSGAPCCGWAVGGCVGRACHAPGAWAADMAPSGARAAGRAVKAWAGRECAQHRAAGSPLA